ncbi:alpha-ketoacid dehydrogenase subunit beta [Nocardiopsis oceani]
MAHASPSPASSEASLTVPAPAPATGMSGTPEAPEVTMGAALNHALHDAMAEDPDVVVYGEDVGPLGGVFRVTDGLTAEFGEERCFDSPLAESGIVGTAIGMAMYGMRPVVEMQFDAFAYPAFEQVVSHLAKMRNRTRGAVTLPVVIRVPYGGGIGGVEHHSDSSEAYYTHTPGLRVVTPGTPADAYSMMREAIACDDPVVFLEPKRRYWAKQSVELPVRTEPMERSVVRRPGADVTLIAYGPMVETALEAAGEAAGEPDREMAGKAVDGGHGIDVEVVDLRQLAPFDDETVTASVRRTGRAVVVHEASVFGGYGAEVAARVTEQCFHYLEAPVLRVGGLDVPYPPPKLEEHHLPGVDRILAAFDRLQWESEWVEGR